MNEDNTSINKKTDREKEKRIIFCERREHNLNVHEKTDRQRDRGKENDTVWNESFEGQGHSLYTSTRIKVTIGILSRREGGK